MKTIHKAMIERSRRRRRRRRMRREMKKGCIKGVKWSKVKKKNR